MHPASGLDTFSKFNARSLRRTFLHAAGDYVAVFVLRDVFVEAGGNQLLHAETQAALLGVDLKHLRLHHLAHLQHFLRVIDALLRADVADVDHAFHPFGQLDERAELLVRLVTGPSTTEPTGNFCTTSAQGSPSACLSPGRSVGRPVDAEDDHVHLTRPASPRREGLRIFLRPRHLGDMDQSLDALFQFHERAEIGDARHGAVHPLDRTLYFSLTSSQGCG